MDDHELIDRFEDGSFPFQEWNHRAHLKIAYLYLMRYPFEEAMGRIRKGLQRLIQDNQVPETPGSGYHETITRAWMQLVDTALREHGTAPNADLFLQQHAQLCNKRILRLFYSRDRILSPEAKKRYVSPDLAPLPQSQKPKCLSHSNSFVEAASYEPVMQRSHQPC